MNKQRMLSVGIASVFVGIVIVFFLFSSMTPVETENNPLVAEENAAASASLPATGGDAVRERDKGARSGKGAKVSVTRVSIADRQVLRQNKPIVVSFSAPMVDASTVEKVLEEHDMPFILDPPVAGQGRWLTTDSFAFVPSPSGYARGKEYTLELRRNLQALDGTPVHCLFSFKTESTRVRTLNIGGMDKDLREQRLHFAFSLPVSREALREHLRFIDGDTGEQLEFSLPEEGTYSAHHAVLVKLGKERASLKLSIRPDADADAHPLGFSEEYANTVKLNFTDNGVPQVVGSEGRPSTVSISGGYSREDSDGALRVTFYLSKSLGPQVQKDLVRISPELPYRMNSDSHMLFISEGVEPGMRITATLLPGLVDEAGNTLAEERSHSITVGDRRTSARFLANGNFLTPVYGGRLGVALVNADMVTVQVYRQYDNNLPLMSLEPDYFVRDLMRDIYSKSIRVKDLKKNEIAHRAIDLNEITKGRKGVFRVQLSAYAEHKDEDGEVRLVNESSGERLVILSDIGATTRVFPSGITVFASSLSSAEPLPAALVKVYSRSNQLLATGRTGNDGVFVHQRQTPWDTQLQPHIVVIQTGEGDNADMTFLPLTHETRAPQEDQGTRPYIDKGYEAFMYTPRGVFRPGEKVDIKAFVRDGKHLSPAPFPVLFKVRSSRDVIVAQGSVTLSAEGGADFAFTLPDSASTGAYHAELEIPGQPDSVLGDCSFSVEDFVPPRLEVAVTPESDMLQGGGALPVTLSGQYLFGAPGAELKYEFGYKATKKIFSPEEFEGYAFGDGEDRFTTESKLDYITGALDAEGLARESFSAPSGWAGSSLKQVMLVLSVQEDGGRWVSKTATFDYFPKPCLLGLKLEEESLSPGSPGNFSLVAVNPKGEIAESGRLSVEISRVQGNWHAVYNNGRYAYTWDERLLPVQRMSVETGKGKGSFSFTPLQSGTYLVRAASEDGELVVSRRFSAWGESGEEGTGRMDLAELAFDKKEYAVGETARLSVKAPYAGTLFLGIERGSQLSTRVLRMDKAAVELDIPVTADMDPNASVTVCVLRPVREEDREWYAHRASGVLPLLLSREPHTLRVSAQAPARAAPAKPLSVPFRVTDHQGMPVEGEFSAALVDEGILSLTMFRTPDPVRFFMEQRFMGSHGYDAFDALLRPEARATPLLVPGGGMGKEYQGSLSTEQIFLAGFLPTVRTDANGLGEAHFDVPEYSGKGRLMIVGASGSRFASADTQIRFARDIVMETSAPRAVAPGDTFDLSLKLFTLPGDDGTTPEGEARVRVSVEGPVALSGDVEKTLPLTPEPGQSRVSHALEIKALAGQEGGIARFAVDVSVPGRDDLAYRKTVETVIRPPFPRTSASRSVLVLAGDEQKMSVPGEWLPGNASLSFSIDRSPVMAVLPSLQFLREYPYGCLEQTISRAWPYLTMTEIQNALYPGKDESAAANAVLKDVVTRVTAMMTPDGGFGLWPGYVTADPWKSVNAAFFLQEVKSRVPVAPSVIQRTLGYLRFILAAPVESFHNERYAYSTKAYAAFVLTKAGEAPLGWLQTLSAHQERMYPSGLIFLAGAKALKAGNAEALKELDEQKLLLSSPVPFNESLEGDLRNMSMWLYMWSLVAPANERTARLSVSVAERLGGLRWHTTQDAGMAALALGTYLDKTGTGNASYSAEISLDHKELARISAGERLVLGSERLPMSGSTAPEITVSLGKEGNAYCIYSVRGVPLKAPQPSSNGLAVQRVWKSADGRPIDMTSGPVRLKKGDRITVELSIKSGGQISDVVLSDLLPGGMEVENARLLTSTAGASEEDDSHGGGRNGLYVDQREDRMLVFFDRMDGLRTYAYTMRAVSKGAFVLPPLAGECMYDPGVNAVTSSGTVVVE